MNIWQKLDEEGLSLGGGQARRYIGLGLVFLNGEVIKDSLIELKQGDILELKLKKNHYKWIIE